MEGHIYNSHVTDFWVLCIGLSIGFEDTAYTVSEDSGTVEVCLTFEGPLKNSSFVELQISFTSASASGMSTAI